MNFNQVSAHSTANLCRNIFSFNTLTSLDLMLDQLVLLNKFIQDTSEPEIKQSLINKLNEELQLLKMNYGEKGVLKFYQKMRENLNLKTSPVSSNKKLKSDFIPSIYQTELNSINPFFSLLT